MKWKHYLNKQYYNASIKGHNVLMFGRREMKISQRSRGEKYSDEFAD